MAITTQVFYTTNASMPDDLTQWELATEPYSSNIKTIPGVAAGLYYVKVRNTDGVNYSPFSQVYTVTIANPPAGNTPPVANAGSDNTITLPTNSVTLVGSGTDSDGTIASYAWIKVSGGAATITSPNAATTTVTGLVEGAYVFRLTVTDNQGATHTDEVSITVNPVAAPSEVILYEYDANGAQVDTSKIAIINPHPAAITFSQANGKLTIAHASVAETGATAYGNRAESVNSYTSGSLRINVVVSEAKAVHYIGFGVDANNFAVFSREGTASGNVRGFIKSAGVNTLIDLPVTTEAERKWAFVNAIRIDAANNGSTDIFKFFTSIDNGTTWVAFGDTAGYTANIGTNKKVFAGLDSSTGGLKTVALDNLKLIQL